MSDLNSHIRTLYALAFLAAVLAMGAVSQAHAVMLVSRSQEVSIGKQVEESVIKEYGGLSTDKAVVERVERIGKKVAEQSPRQDVTYTYKVLNSDVINAFAAPGGPVLITKALARMLSTDDELAFVLAHETGHIAAQHGREAINRALLAQGIASLLFRRASETARIGASVVYTLYDRGYSRSQEYQADAHGVQIMRDSGHNPEGAVVALAKLGMKRASGLDKYLATHPDIPDRIDRVAQMSGITPERQKELVAKATR